MIKDRVSLSTGCLHVLLPQTWAVIGLDPTQRLILCSPRRDYGACGSWMEVQDARRRLGCKCAGELPRKSGAIPPRLKLRLLPGNVDYCIPDFGAPTSPYQEWEMPPPHGTSLIKRFSP
ncbi:hypothetical protein AGIG_G11107 [Arapaima gigas]